MKSKVGKIKKTTKSSGGDSGGESDNYSGGDGASRKAVKKLNDKIATLKSGLKSLKSKVSKNTKKI